MKTYLKTIRWKQTHDRNDKNADRTPCINCKKALKECEGVDCASLKNWLRGMDEATVEWEADYSCLKIARMICRTIVWIALVLLLGFVACKWNGVIGDNTNDTSDSVKSSCKEVGK